MANAKPEVVLKYKLEQLQTTNETTEIPAKNQVISLPTVLDFGLEVFVYQKKAPEKDVRVHAPIT